METHAASFPFTQYRRLVHGAAARPACPRCAHNRVHRWGSFSGRRRYRCVGCGRTFSDFTRTPLAYIKHIDRWPAFCHCMLASMTVRRAAQLLDIDKTTAFRWRHRILRVLDASDTAPFGSSLAIQETWFPYSEKGRRSCRTGVYRGQPRGAPEVESPGGSSPGFERGRWHAADGTDPLRAWVVITRDDTGRFGGAVVGPQRPGASDLERILGARISSTDELVGFSGPYSAVGILAARIARAGDHAVTYRRAIRESPVMAAIRRHILGLRRWLRGFRGVATRYLSNYLAWYRYLVGRGTGPGVADASGLLAARFP